MICSNGAKPTAFPTLKSGRRQDAEKEPNVSKDIKGALWAPTAGICWPFGMALAFAENAVINGAEVLRECQVTGITVENGAVKAVETDQGTIETKYVINAAGVHADDVSRMAGDDSFTIMPRRGEYILFDKTAQKDLVYSPIFPTPTKMGKGILVCATTHGNVFVGPNAHDLDGSEKDDTAVTIPGMNEILEKARKLVPNIPAGTFWVPASVPYPAPAIFIIGQSGKRPRASSGSRHTVPGSDVSSGYCQIHRRRNRR